MRTLAAAVVLALLAATPALAAEKLRVATTGGYPPFTYADDAGEIWTMDEHALTAEDGRVLCRIPTQRAFWFGWYAAFPNTRLVR